MQMVWQHQHANSMYKCPMSSPQKSNCQSVMAKSEIVFLMAFITCFKKNPFSQRQFPMEEDGRSGWQPGRLTQFIMGKTKWGWFCKLFCYSRSFWQWLFFSCLLAHSSILPLFSVLQGLYLGCSRLPAYGPNTSQQQSKKKIAFNLR